MARGLGGRGRPSRLLFLAQLMLAGPIICGSITQAAHAETQAGTAKELFDLADQLRMHTPDEAMAIYQTLQLDPNIAIRSEARFRQAKLLISMGRLGQAALLFRAILDEQPEAAPVRLELASVLAQMGDLSAARRELRQAQSGSLPPDVAAAVNQFVAALRSRKPWGGSFELALAPDSNINRATNSTTLDTIIAPLTLSEDAQEQSGIGLKQSSQIYARLNAGRQWSIVPRATSQAALYRQSDFNDISVSGQLGVEVLIGADRVTPSLGHSWRWYGRHLYARTQNLGMNWLHPAGRQAQLDSSASISRVRHVRNALQDGMIYAAAIGYERALSPRTGARLSLSANRQTARDPGYATASGGLAGLVWHDIGKVTLFATADANRLEADTRLFLFPKRRTDWFLRGGAGAIIRKIVVAGLSPVVRFGYERNWSTVGLYDYRRLSTDFGISRAF